MSAARSDHRLASLLNPSAVAVVGATDRLGAFTGDTVHNLLRFGFPGAVHPVNPNRTEVAGLPCVPSLRDLSTPVDCAVLAVGADRVIDVLADCVATGIHSAIVTASGFGEGGAGPTGVARRADLDAFLVEHPMALLGPSTTGLINLADAFVPRAATNLLAADQLRAGPVAVISQSGASNNIVFNRAQEHGLGVGLAVATGLQANVSVWDVVDYTLLDDRYSVLAVLVEELGPPQVWRRYLAAARESGRSVVVCKVGRSDRGAAAVATHSGSIAGIWDAQEQALRDAGAILVDDLDQLWEVAALCASWGPPTGPVRLGAVAMSGGEGALITDLADAADLEMPDVSAEFEAVVADNLTLTRGSNPFDPSGEVLGRPRVLEPVLRSFLSEASFDRVLVAWHILDDHVLTDAWPQVLALFAEQRHRVVVSGWPLSGLPAWRRLCTADGPPLVAGSHRAVAAIAAYARGATSAGSGVAPPPVARWTARMDAASSYLEVREILAGLGVDFGAGRVVGTADDAAAAAREYGYPLVLKVDGPSIRHKSAAGLVAVGLRSEEQVRAAYERLAGPADAPTVVVAEEHVLGELQLFLGVRVDEEIGPILLVGSGGSAVEFLGDVVVGPPRPAEFAELLGRSAIGRFLLDRAPGTVAGLTEMSSALLELCGDDRVRSVELNPVVVDLTSGRVRAVDARVGLAPDPTGRDR